MAIYFCHISRNGVRFDDPFGFEALDHDDAVELARGIGAIILRQNPDAGDAMIEIRTESGVFVFASSLSALLTDLQ